MSRRLALFDFDGTITTRDTMFAFVRHVRGPVRTALGLLWLSPMLVAHRLGFVGSERAKVLFLRHFLGGAGRDALAAHARTFVAQMEAWIRPGARARLEWHRAEGHDVVLVSASLDLWLAPWAEHHRLRLLCTEVRWDADAFTGALATPNCNGPAKADRVRGAIDLDAYEYVYGYGDSAGDVEMLALADEVAFRPFR
jgi:HAD superfamily hydrolase (TIGR01490 family)